MTNHVSLLALCLRGRPVCLVCGLNSWFRLSPVFIVLLIFLMPVFLRGQNTLNLKSAITNSLAYNHDILLSLESYAIAKNNNSYGNAGLLPDLSLSGSYNRSLSTTHQEYSDGRVRDGNNASAYAMTTGLNLVWDVFEGGAVFIRKKQLELQEQMGMLAWQADVENTVAGVIGAYTGVVVQEKLLEAFREAVKLSKQRLELEQTRLALGAGTKLGMLQAQVDMNSDSAALALQENALFASRLELNRLMGLKADTMFVLNDTLFRFTEINLADITSALDLNNPELLGLEARESLKCLDFRLAHAPRYPKLSIFSGYSFAISGTEVGLMELNRGFGPNAGISISYPLFSGFANETKIANARHEHRMAEIELRKQGDFMKSEALRVWQAYNTRRSMIGFEEKNCETALLASELAFGKYRLGEYSAIDFRAVQLDYLSALGRLWLARFEAKKLETELLRLGFSLK